MAGAGSAGSVPPMLTLDRRGAGGDDRPLLPVLPGGGLRAAGRGPRRGRVESFYPCRNAAESARVYTIEPRDHLLADRDAEARGLTIVGRVPQPHPHRALPEPDRRGAGARPGLALRDRQPEAGAHPRPGATGSRTGHHGGACDHPRPLDLRVPRSDGGGVGCSSDSGVANLRCVRSTGVAVGQPTLTRGGRRPPGRRRARRRARTGLPLRPRDWAERAGDGQVADDRRGGARLSRPEAEDPRLQPCPEHGTGPAADKAESDLERDAGSHDDPQDGAGQRAAAVTGARRLQAAAVPASVSCARPPVPMPVPAPPWPASLRPGAPADQHRDPVGLSPFHLQVGDGEPEERLVEAVEQERDHPQDPDTAVPKAGPHLTARRALGSAVAGSGGRGCSGQHRGIDGKATAANTNGARHDQPMAAVAASSNGPRRSPTSAAMFPGASTGPDRRRPGRRARPRTPTRGRPTTVRAGRSPRRGSTARRRAPNRPC